MQTLAEKKSKKSKKVKDVVEAPIIPGGPYFSMLKDDVIVTILTHLDPVDLARVEMTCPFFRARHAPYYLSYPEQAARIRMQDSALRWYGGPAKEEKWTRRLQTVLRLNNRYSRLAGGNSYSVVIRDVKPPPPPSPPEETLTPTVLETIVEVAPAPVNAGTKKSKKAGDGEKKKKKGPKKKSKKDKEEEERRRLAELKAMATAEREAAILRGDIFPPEREVTEGQEPGDGSFGLGVFAFGTGTDDSIPSLGLETVESGPVARPRMLRMLYAGRRSRRLLKKASSACTDTGGDVEPSGVDATGTMEELGPQRSGISVHAELYGKNPIASDPNITSVDEGGTRETSFLGGEGDTVTPSLSQAQAAEDPLTRPSTNARQVVHVSAGYEHTVFLMPPDAKRIETEEGEESLALTCGRGEWGRLGRSYDDGSPSIPMPLFGLPARRKVVFATAGYFHTVLLTDRGEAYTFGNGECGALGHGDTNDSLRPRFVEALGHKYCTAAGAGMSYSVFVTHMGTAFACGRNDRGQLGMGEVGSNVLSVRRVGVGALVGVRLVSVSAGAMHTLFVTDRGALYSCGEGPSGQLGHGKSRWMCSVPERVERLRAQFVVRCAASMVHSVALTDTGKVYTFGQAPSCGHPPEGRVVRRRRTSRGGTTTTAITKFRPQSAPVTSASAAQRRLAMNAASGADSVAGRPKSAPLGSQKDLYDGAIQWLPRLVKGVEGHDIIDVCVGRADQAHTLLMSRVGRVFSFGPTNEDYQLGFENLLKGKLLYTPNEVF
eukprot:Rmarinus@m.25055